MQLMPPLWLRYPHIPEGSIGWRMGYGEAYAHDFYKWFYSLTDLEKADYRKKFPDRFLNPIRIKFLCFPVTLMTVLVPHRHSNFTFHSHVLPCSFVSQTSTQPLQSAGKTCFAVIITQRQREVNYIYYIFTENFLYIEYR